MLIYRFCPETLASGLRQAKWSSACLVTRKGKSGCGL